jgi:hypothetical protein
MHCPASIHLGFQYVVTVHITIEDKYKMRCVRPGGPDATHLAGAVS